MLISMRFGFISQLLIRVVFILAFSLVFIGRAAHAQDGSLLRFLPTPSTPSDAPGRGKHIVLVCGDEEYRSEEALPQLAGILSERHGFRCTVLFSIEEGTGVVDPDDRTHIPGLDALEDADCMVLFTRFRDLPDEQMQFIDRYVRLGSPVLGIRTATHAFNIERGRAFDHYSWNYKPQESDEEHPEWEGGFGRLILGETWIAHHGRHGSQSTQGIVAPSAAEHPIARGLAMIEESGATASEGVWGPTDVYRVRLPMLEEVEPIILGRVLDGMAPGTPAVEGEQNEPLMPILWTKRYQIPGGEPGVSVTSTLGASKDLVATGSRRMLINAVYWLCGLGDSIPIGGTDARGVGRFEPSDFGFGGARKGMLPRAFSPNQMQPESSSLGEQLELRDGDRVVLIGSTFAERLASSGYFAAMVHATHPDLDISVRHIPWAGDEAGDQRREMNVPTTIERLNSLEPTVIIACYGMSESFAGDEGLEAFQRDLRELIESFRNASFSRAGPVRVGLVSPIHHEDLGGSWISGVDLAERNRSIDQFVQAMDHVGQQLGAEFCNLTEVEAELSQLTTNGIHPSEKGCRVYSREIAIQFGWLNPEDDPSAPADQAAASNARRLAADMYYHERLWFRPTNTEYVYGRRHEPFGVVNYPPEMAQLERMIVARDRELNAAGINADALFQAPLGDTPFWELIPSSNDFAVDQWSPEPVVPEGTETSLGSLEIESPQAFLASFTLAEGYEVNVFASEEMFPELANPLAMTFDEDHRLWVICAHTYPHLMPGEEPRCQIVVIEDTDNDGVADRSWVYADRLYIPTGFAVETDGVYLGQAPDLLFLRDTDTDGRADRREVIYTGFSMPDSHHTISSFEWDPHGGFLMHEGVFGISTVETPWGTLRSRDAAVWRFDTRTRRLTRLSHSSFANPWGHAFDDYGQSVLADASGGANHSFGQVIYGAEDLGKPAKGDAILNRGRPTAGCEILASRHFPNHVQGTFLVNQCIGFHGTRWNRLSEPSLDSSAWTSESLEQDLIESSDVNFRPVAMEVGPDGTLYLADWCNPIIGHMQYSVRDPRRDSTHGRIWRVRHSSRETLSPPVIPDGSSPRELMQLLELLRLPETNTRRHARRRLQQAPSSAVLRIAQEWVAGLDHADPLHDRLNLELLWLMRAHGRVDISHLERVSNLQDARVRAGAVRILRHWMQEGVIALGPALRILDRSARDGDMRVRLEAVVACGFAETPDAVSIIEVAAAMPADTALQRAIQESVRFLGRHEGEPTDFARRFVLESMPAEELIAQPASRVLDEVMLTRTDVSRSMRNQAADRVRNSSEPGVFARIIMQSGHPDSAASAIAPYVFAQDDRWLRAGRNEYAQLAGLENLQGALGLGVLERLGEPSFENVQSGDERLVQAAMMLSRGSISEDFFRRLIAEAESGALPAERVVDVAVRHGFDASSRDEYRSVFQERWIDPAQEQTLEQWDEQAELAVAGLRGVALLRSVVDELEQSAPVMLAPSQLYENGRALYHSESVGCVRCHAEDGSGLEGFPRLSRSPWVHGDADRLIAITLGGLTGEITLPDGASYNSAMAPLGQLLDDEQAAAVLTFVRQSFGNFAAPITPIDVARVRRQIDQAQGILRVDDVLSRYPMQNDLVVPGRHHDASSDSDALSKSGPATDGRANDESSRVPTAFMLITLILAILSTRRVGSS